jgi:putative MATE family efflux protein
MPIRGISKYFQTRDSSIDLTKGNLFKKMLLFIVPVVLASLLQLLYTTADLLVVNYVGGGGDSMAAVGDNGSLINLVVVSFVSISVGANVVVADAKGSLDFSRGNKALHSSLLLSLMIGVMVAIIGYFLAPTILVWMQTPESILPLASLYLRIYFLGVPFLMLYNFGAAILRGLGDSFRSLVVLFLCGIINVGGNLALVYLFYRVLHIENGDIIGVGLSTVICELLQALLVIYFLAHTHDKSISFSFSKLKIAKKETKEVLANGLPSGLEAFIFAITNVVIQSQANRLSSLYGNGVVVGLTASDNIEGYIFAILEAFAVGIVAVVAQNLGAKNKENLKKSLLYSIGSIVVIGIILGGGAALLHDSLLGLYISDTSSAEGTLAMASGTARLLLMGLTYVLCALMDCGSGYLRGLGHPVAPTLVTLLCAVLFRLGYVFGIFNTLIFPSSLDVSSKILLLYASYPLCWVLASIIYAFMVPHYMKKAFRMIDERPNDNVPTSDNKAEGSGETPHC